MSECMICKKILLYEEGEDEEQPLCKKHMIPEKQLNKMKVSMEDIYLYILMEKQSKDEIE